MLVGPFEVIRRRGSGLRGEFHASDRGADRVNSEAQIQISRGLQNAPSGFHVEDGGLTEYVAIFGQAGLGDLSRIS